MRSSSLRCALLGLLLLSGIGSAQADNGLAAGGIPAPPNDPCFQDVLCKGHYQRARVFSKSGELESALNEYQIAFKLQPVPWLLLNIARTLHKLGKLPDAVDKYQRYIDQTQQNGDEELRTKAQEYLEQAKKELAERPPADPEPPPPVITPKLVPDHLNSPNGGIGTTDSGIAAAPAKPVYKKWWFWTIIGVATAGAVAGVVGGVLASQNHTPVPTVPTDADAYRPMF